MSLPFLFSGVTSATGPQLDADLAALGVLTTIGCSVSGTNAISLTPALNTPTVSAYANYQRFSFIAGVTNTGAMTASVGALPALNIYKDTTAGPIALKASDVTAGNVVTLVYDSALAGGTGGFHLSTVSPSVEMSSTSTITANAGTTLTAANLTGGGTGFGLILRKGTLGAGFNDATDTALAIVGAISGAVVNAVFRFRVINTSGQTQTLTAGANVTVNATNNTTANDATHDFVGIITNVGTPAVSIFG